MSAIKDPENVCFICKKKSDSSEDNILKFGDWQTKSDISVHRFCLYFIYGVHTRARNDILDTDYEDSERENQLIEGENIFGFLVTEIKNRVRLNYHHKCIYCNKRNAATWCAGLCRRKFHFDCGQQNNVQYQFYGEFQALCSQHHDIDEESMAYDSSQDCFICEEPLGPYHLLNSIPSCCKQNFYHRDCVKKAALYQGYDMKCMSCGATDDLTENSSIKDDNTITSMPRKEYIRFLEHRGIFVPMRMASWEEPNAYADSGNLRLPCKATKCLCPEGRDFSEKTGIWKIIKCSTCGGSGIHSSCFGSEDNYICPDCHMETQHSDVDNELSQRLEMAEAIPEGLPCKATICFCPEGTDFSEETGKWEIIKCCLCGRNGIHSSCFGSEDNYICPDCDMTEPCKATMCFCYEGADYSEETGKWEMIKCSTCGGNGIHRSCFGSQGNYTCPDCHMEPQHSDVDNELSQRLEMSAAIPEGLPCKAIKCVCPKGRDFKEKTRMWKIIKCVTCGEKGIHLLCFNSRGNYTCPDCHMEPQHSDVDNEDVEVAEPIPEQSPKLRVSTAYVTKLNELRDKGQVYSDSNEWQFVDVPGYLGKRKVIDVRKSDDEDKTNQMTDDGYREELKQFEIERLNIFFQKAQFTTTPITPMHILDQMEIYWANEAEMKEK